MTSTADTSPSALVRPAQKADLPQLLEMNNAAVPAVNELTLSELSDLVAEALVCLVAELDGQPAGMLLCLTEGLDYDSRNYAWLSEHVGRFAYTDRICVAETARGQRIGEALYEALGRVPDVGNRPFVCEVNTRPENPGSLRFHKRLGFAEIGSQDHGEKAVVYLKRDPAGDVKSA